MTNNGKLTPEITKEICDKIKKGVSRREAALTSGICEVTYYDWIKKGKAQKSGKYAKFLKYLKNAEAHLKASYEMSIFDAKTKHWSASMTWLERRHPDEYGKSDRMHVEHSGKVRISFDDFKEIMGDEK